LEVGEGLHLQFQTSLNFHVRETARKKFEIHPKHNTTATAKLGQKKQKKQKKEMWWEDGN